MLLAVIVLLPHNNFKSPLSKYIRINITQEKSLKKLGILTVQDILYHYPYYYNHSTANINLDNIELNKVITVYGSIHNLSLGKTWKTKKAVANSLTPIDRAMTNPTE